MAGTTMLSSEVFRGIAVLGIGRMIDDSSLIREDEFEMCLTRLTRVWTRKRMAKISQSTVVATETPCQNENLVELLVEPHLFGIW